MNITETDIPWHAIRTLISQSIYGGRIDNPMDQKLIDSILVNLLNPTSFKVGFKLVKDFEDDMDGNRSDLEAPTILQETTLQDYIRWCDSLPESNSPKWLGLPTLVENKLLTNHCIWTIARFA